MEPFKHQKHIIIDWEEWYEYLDEKDCIHRLNGPAIEYLDEELYFCNQYYIHGKQYLYNEYCHIIKEQYPEFFPEVFAKLLVDY